MIKFLPTISHVNSHDIVYTYKVKIMQQDLLQDRSSMGNFYGYTIHTIRDFPRTLNKSKPGA